MQMSIVSCRCDGDLFIRVKNWWHFPFGTIFKASFAFFALTTKSLQQQETSFGLSLANNRENEGKMWVNKRDGKRQ